MTTPRFLGREGQRWQEDISGARYQEVALERVSFTYFSLDPGTAYPEHRHDSEQITFVIEGCLEFEIEGERYSVRSGEAIAVPSGVPHAVRAGSEPVLAVDAWSPPPSHLA